MVNLFKEISNNSSNMKLLTFIAFTILCEGIKGNNSERKGLYECYRKKKSPNKKFTNQNSNTKAKDKDHPEYKVFYIHIDSFDMVTYIRGKKKLPIFEYLDLEGEFYSKPENILCSKNFIKKDKVLLHFGDLNHTSALCKVVKPLKKPGSDSKEDSDINNISAKQISTGDSENSTGDEIKGETTSTAENTVSCRKKEEIEYVICSLNKQNNHINSIIKNAQKIYSNLKKEGEKEKQWLNENKTEKTDLKEKYKKKFKRVSKYIGTASDFSDNENNISCIKNIYI